MIPSVTLPIAASGLESGLILFIGLAVVVVGVAFAVSAFQSRLARARTEAMKNAVLGIGFSFEGEQWADKSRAPTLGTALFARGRKGKFNNISSGSRDGLRVSLFDYSMTVGRGKGAHTEAQTVGAFSKDRVYLPYFELRRSGTFDKLWDSFAHENIHFDSSPEFTRQFALRSPAEADARSLFSDALLSFFAQMNPQAKWTVEGQGNTLIIYRRQMRTAPTELREFLDETASVASSIFSLGNFPVDKNK